MKKLKDVDILAEVNYQASQASGSEFAADELTDNRKNAIRYYLGRTRGDEVEGRSAVISMDVADMIDSMLTQLMPMFDSDDLVSFEPVSEQDEEQARTESKFCNHIVMERNQGFMLFETLLKDCLLSKNSIAKVRIDVEQKIEKERYKNLTPEEMFVVLQPTKENQEVDVTMFNEDEGKVNLKRITTKRRLVVEAVAPENFNITSEHKSPFLDNATYCNERSYVTKSDLIEKYGFDKKTVQDLPTSTSDTKIDSVERNQINDEQNFFNTNTSMQIVELFEHYIRIDQDGDGIAELHKVFTVENILLSNEEVDDIPYANGTAFLMGHRFYGQSVYDKIKDVQDSKTFYQRQWQDNALIHNHKKYLAVEDLVNMDDLLNGRPNGVIRVENLNAVSELQTTDIGPSCLLAMDYYDKIRTERSGSALDLQANQPNMPSNVGDQGVTTLIANLEKVTALVAKNFSETMVYSLYKLVHRFQRQFIPEEMTKKFGGQFTQTNPGQWLEREQLNITVPPTNSEKIVQQIALEKAIVQAQSDMAQGKTGITTDEANLYQLRIDHMRLSGIDNPEKYLVNPNSQSAQQAIQAQQQSQQQEQQMQQQMALEQAQAQNELQNELLRAQILEIRRNWENDKEQLQFDYAELAAKLEMEQYKTDVKADVDEAKIVGDNVSKVQTEALKAQNNSDKANQHDQMMQQHQKMMMNSDTMGDQSDDSEEETSQES